MQQLSNKKLSVNYLLILALKNLSAFEILPKLIFILSGHLYSVGSPFDKTTLSQLIKSSDSSISKSGTGKNGT